MESVILSEALAKVTRAANRSADVDSAIDLLLSEAAIAAGADEVALFLYDPASSRLENRRTSLSSYGGRASFGLGEGVVGHVAATGNGLVVADCSTHTEFAFRSGAQAPASLLALPLLAEYSLLGVLSFVSANTNQWGEADLAPLEIFAGIATTLLVQRSLREQLRGRREQLELLSSMTGITPRAERQEHVLSQLATAIATLVRAKSCAFLLSDSEGGFALHADDRPAGERFMLPPSLARSFSDGEIVAVDPSSARGAILPWLRELGPCELTFVPFTLESGLGVLFVRTEQGVALDANARGALRLASAQAAHLIDNMHLYRSLQHSYFEAVASLASSIEARDALTKGHSQAVSDYCVRFGRIVELDATTLESLRMSSLLHDVGKIAVPDAILLKPGPLTNEEWAIMRRHPEFGARIVRPLPIADRLLPAILYHHERWDGQGYPQGLAGDRIPLIARITTVLDAYQVIVAERPYKKGRPMHEAVAEIARCSGTQFDPHLAEIFCKHAVEIDPERAEKEGYTGFTGTFGTAANEVRPIITRS